MKRSIWTILVAVALSKLFCMVCEAIQDDSLVLYLSMDEGSGDRVEDKSGKENDGVLVGDPKWVDGKFGSAIELDGVDDCIEVQDDESLKPEELTIALWVEFHEIPASNTGIVDKFRFPDQGYPGYLLQTKTVDPFEPLLSSGDMKFAVFRGAGIGEVVADTWYHVAMTFDGTILKLYINGKVPEYDEAASTTELPEGIKHVDENLIIGERVTDGTFLKGVVDELMIFNRALSIGEILSIMEQGFAVRFNGRVSVTWGALKDQ